MLLYATALPCGCMHYLPKQWLVAPCYKCNKTFTQETTPPIKRKKRN